jgi:1,4-alpha-glucan branching enzyme
MENNPAHGPIRQRFTATADRAEAVKLVGDFTMWHEHPLFLQKGEDGIWWVDVELAPGTYHFRFVVDHEPETGPEEVLEVPGPGGRNEVIHRDL